MMGALHHKTKERKNFVATSSNCTNSVRVVTILVNFTATRSPYSPLHGTNKELAYKLLWF